MSIGKTDPRLSWRRSRVDEIIGLDKPILPSLSMKPQRSEKWKRWRTKVTKDCNELARGLGGTAPAVALRDIARHRRITRVVFRPLLVEGGLGRRGNGFVMYVNCAAERVRDYTARFHENGPRFTKLRKSQTA